MAYLLLAMVVLCLQGMAASALFMSSECITSQRNLLKRSSLMWGLPSRLMSSTGQSTSSGFGGSGTSSGEAWNLTTLRKEVARQYLRCFKKVSKAHDRVSLVQRESPDNPTAIDGVRKELNDLSARLNSIRDIESTLASISSTSDPIFAGIIPKLQELDITDAAPQRPPRPPKVPKSSSSSGPRLPYKTYQSIDGIEIRVGRSAADNDLLSCDKAYRDDKNWWMHVSGHPGSHVVIRNTNDDFLVTHPETIVDAAVLTAIHSKCSQAGRVVVTMTRCRNVSKPKDAKPGLVQLTGVVKQIKVDLHREQSRLERLKSPTNSILQ